MRQSGDLESYECLSSCSCTAKVAIFSVMYNASILLKKLLVFIITACCISRCLGRLSDKIGSAYSPRIGQHIEVAGTTKKPFTTLNDMLTSPGFARGLLFLSSACYGIDYSLTKALQRDIPCEVLTALQFIIATVVSLPSFFLSTFKRIDGSASNEDYPEKNSRKLDMRAVRIGLELGVWSGAAVIATGYALMTSTASKVSFFSALCVIMPPLYDFIHDTLKQFISHISRKNHLKHEHGTPAGSSINIGLNVSRNGDRSKMSLTKIIKISGRFVAPVFAIIGAAVLEGDDDDDDMGGAATATAFAATAAAGSTAVRSIWLRDVALIMTPVMDSMGTWRAEKLGDVQAYDIPVSAAVMLATSAVVTSAYAYWIHGDSLPAAWNQLQSALSACSTLAKCSDICESSNNMTYYADSVGYSSCRIIPTSTCPAAYRHQLHRISTVLTALTHLIVKHRRNMLLLLTSSTIGIAFTTLMEQYALTVVSAAETFLLLSMEPVLATGFAALLLGEEIGMRTFIGAGFILCACAWPCVMDLLNHKLAVQVPVHTPQKS